MKKIKKRFTLSNFFLKNLPGFSLIEVVVFVGILSMFFVAGISVATYSLQTMKSNEYKIKATQYAEELMEWIKAQKEIDWKSFVTNRVGSGNSYCFNSAITTWPVSGACLLTDFNLPSDYSSTNNVFRRNVSLSGGDSPVTKVDINIEVQWKEPSGTITVPLTSTLTLWE